MVYVPQGLTEGGTGMLGKAKCKILKEIRQKIADENDIPYVTRECTYQGDCSGTCPRCESELQYLERELERRERIGKKVAVAALCTGIAVGMTGCDLPGRELGGAVAEPPEPYEEELAGAVEPVEPEPVEIESELTGDVAEPLPEIIETEGEVAMPFENEDSQCGPDDTERFNPISKEAVEEAVESVQGN